MAIIIQYTVHNVNKSQRNNYMYKSDASVNPTLARVLYNQAKTLQDFKNYSLEVL